MLFSLVAACAILCAAGTKNYEWAGIFSTSENTYLWTAQKVGGAYADATMKFAAISASSATEAALNGLEPTGNTLLGGACTPLQANQVIPVNGACYDLTFDNSMWQSLWKVDASSASAVAFFAQHVPTEFENTAHYLKDDHGDDIEPVAELPVAAPTPAPTPAPVPETSKPWGAAIGASIIVQMMTLIGVCLAVPFARSVAEKYAAEVIGIFSGFAAGALLACAFFLLLFEATHLIASEWTKEVEVIWRWGTMILAGFCLPGAVFLAVSAATASKAEMTKISDISKRSRLLAGVLIGDFFHNLCDGFFMGAAFKGCGTSFGWGVALGTVLHELPQEIADYMILTGPDVALSPIKALACNFVAGLTVILGTIIVMSSEIENRDIGLLLAFGGGTYLHIAATECMPRVYDQNLKLSVRLACMFAFLVGAILIGLVLLDHEHCVPPAPPGAPAPAPGGHAHGH